MVTNSGLPRMPRCAPALPAMPQGVDVFLATDAVITLSSWWAMPLWLWRHVYM
jgi:hypothetical protein